MNRKGFRKFRSFSLAAWMLGSLTAVPVHAVEGEAYLKKLAQDTYSSILFLVDNQTGLPYDNSRFSRPDTSVSNIGLYLAAEVAACKLGIAKRSDSAKRIRQALNSLAKLQTWNGFTASWNNVMELTPSTQDPYVSVLDTGNLAAGLILVASEFWTLRGDANRLLNAIRWDAAFQSEKGLLHGGYHLNKQELSADWFLDQLGSDARLAYIIAIGQKRIPAGCWSNLSRRMEERYGLHYLAPGWQGGGMFMQFITGLFLDEAGTLMGRSAGQFAFAQITHAQVINAPVWGWSSCERPDGRYMGWNQIEDEIVTPHASVLALRYFPKPVVDNLRKLEALGARRPFKNSGRDHAFGFSDSVDWKHQETNGHFLVLDQCMLLLALADHLTQGGVQAVFAKHPVIQQALAEIPDYQIGAEEREAFYDELRALSADKVILRTEPLRIVDDPSGQKTLIKEVRLINFTNRTYPRSQFAWTITVADTNELVNQGNTVVDLEKYSSLRVDPPKLRITDDRHDGEVFLIEAKLTDPQGKVLSECVSSFPP